MSAPAAPRRAVAAVVIVLLICSAAAGLGGTVPGRPAGAATTQAAASELMLASQTSWSSVGGTFTASIDVRGAPAGSRLAVEVHPEVSGRIRFEQSTAGEGLGSPLGPGVPDIALAERFPGPEGTVDLAIPLRGPTDAADPADPTGVVLPSSGAQGAYPVAVRLLDAEGAELDELITHLVVLPSGPDVGPPLSVAVVVPVDLAPPGGTTFAPTGEVQLDPDALDQLEAALGALVEAPTVPATLAVSPASVDALATTAAGTSPAEASSDGTSSDGSEPGPDQERAAGILEQLRAATPGRQVPATAYAPLALGSWVARASIDPAAATALDAERQAGAAAVVRTLGVHPSTSTALLDPSVDPAALGWLADRGATQVVVPEAQLDDVRDLPSEAEWLLPFSLVGDGGERVAATMADTAVAAQLTATGDPVLDGHRTLANLAVLWGDLPALRRGVVVAPEPGAGVPAATWDVVLEGLEHPTSDPPAAGASQAVVAPTTLDELFAAVGGGEAAEAGELPERPYRWDEPGSLGSLPGSIASTLGRVTSFASMAGDRPALPLGRQALLAASAPLTAAEGAAHLGAAGALLEDRLAGVVASDAQRVTLTEPKGTLPLTLENQLPYDVDVDVTMSSDKVSLPDGETIRAQLPAGTTTRLEIAVESRVTGAFPLDVTVRSPDGGLDVASTRFAVRSITVSGVGLALSLGAGAFLLLWWLRHFRNVRRDRRLVSPDHPSRRRAPASGP